MTPVYYQTQYKKSPTLDKIDQALARKLLSGPWRRVEKQTE
nr:MAG TPA: Cytochrome c oxidase subunit II [Caudoviricetes sp.]DAN69004.1 MAG TPA: Cytochrome c oxidase subunit II [Caudoviricetes sp.]